MQWFLASSLVNGASNACSTSAQVPLPRLGPASKTAGPLVVRPHANVLPVMLAPAQSLMKSFRLASLMAVQRLRELAISLEHKPMEEKKELLKKCAMTTLNSKLVGRTWRVASEWMGGRGPPGGRWDPLAGGGGKRGPRNRNYGVVARPAGQAGTGSRGGQGRSGTRRRSAKAERLATPGNV